MLVSIVFFIFGLISLVFRHILIEYQRQKEISEEKARMLYRFAVITIIFGNWFGGSTIIKEFNKTLPPEKINFTIFRERISNGLKWNFLFGLVYMILLVTVFHSIVLFIINYKSSIIIRKPKITKEDCEKLMRYAIVSLVFGDIIGGSIQIHETKKYIKHVEK